MRFLSHRSTAPSPDSPFRTAFRGRFTNLLTWQRLDDFWQVLRTHAGDGWYIYAIGLDVPAAPRGAEDVTRFIDAVDVLLRAEHDEDYCGIVYVDDPGNPGFIKIFDPAHLGVSCGFSNNPPMPGWILTRQPPEPVQDNRTLPQNRRRWWQSLWT
ncbi:MAG: hypothetical protein AMJ84_13685 [Acidithiobacillales bacterium SM23_46]|jgi:hypothetical protein|nr:MAG: hypothetical protein AMJ84_13685 [Acidithiobacillales bacterium SM23_46]KPL27351.1 MAG: hypothetical protein AMJ72_09365 [Acidithiobacillales bacterium SM1_46]